MKSNHEGFTLIELLIVLAIIGIALRYIVPNIQGSNPRYERQQFVARFNALTQLAWQRALVTRKVQKISVDIGARSIGLFEPVGNSDTKNELIFAPAKGQYIRTAMRIPDTVEIKQFVIEGFDEMGRFGGGKKTTEAYFYIVPEGLAQEVVITFADKNDLIEKRPRVFQLSLNPFNAQFALSEL